MRKYAPTQEQKTLADEKRDRLQDEFDQRFATLLTQLQNGESAAYKKYVQFMSKLHKYSWNNQFLIWLQCDMLGIEPGRMMGYDQWQKAGKKYDKKPFQVRKMERQVVRNGAPVFYKNRKGEVMPYIEHGIVIVRYNPKNVTVVNANGEEETFKLARFKDARIFDESQLTDESRARLPEPWQPMTGEASAFSDAIEQLMAVFGVTFAAESQKEIDRATGRPGSKGYSAIGKIAVLEGLGSADRFHHDAHELAHEILHTEAERLSMPREQREWEAEMTAFAVYEHFMGDGSCTFTPDYLTNWKLNGKDAGKQLRAHMERIAKASHKIIAGMEAMMNPFDGEDDDDE